MSLTRRSLQVVAFVCTLIVGVASMVVIVTQTTWFKEWLRGFIVRQAEDYVNGRLSIGRLDGNLFFGIDLEDVDVTVNGEQVVQVKDVGLDYNVFTFLTGNVVLDDIRLNQPVIRIERTDEGWNITRLIRARTPDPDEPRTRRPLEIGEIGISDGTLIVEGQPVGTSGVALPSRIERLDASLGVTSNEHELRVEIGHVSLRGEAPSIGVNALSGTIRRTPDTITLENVALRTEESSLRVDGTITNIEGGARTFDLRASSDKLDVPEIAQVVPALRGYALQPAFELTAAGPLDRLEVDINAREATLGAVIGDLTVDAAGPERRVAGDVSMERLNIAPLTARGDGRSPVQSNITGTARIDLALPSGRLPLSGTYTLRAARAQVAGYEVRDLNASGRIDGRTIRLDAQAAAYGGRATADGTVRYGAPLALDLAGRASGVDLRNLPPALNMPGAPSDLQFAYTLTGRGRVFSGTVAFDQSTLAGATIADGSTAEFSLGGGATPRYAAKGQVANLDVQQIGQGFAIRAIATDRYKSTVNGTFDVAGSGGGRYPLTLTARGALVDSQMFGATFPRLDLATEFAGGDAQVKAIGQFTGLDPAVITGNARVAGSLTGAADVDTTIRGYANGVTVDSIDVAGRVNLGESQLAGFDIRTAVVDGQYANRTGELTQFAVAGPDLNASGSGTIALNETGASNLALHVESPALDRVGAIVGQPLKGATVIDATITGNARELQAEGTLQGSNIGFGNSEALSLTSTFSAAMPDLRPEDATVQAKSTATFLEVGGQRINQLDAETTYNRANGLQFNAVAREGLRELAANGSAIFHPDHQEVHLGGLSLRVEQIEWRTAPGSGPTIHYGDGRVTIENLHLVSGDQRIDAAGTIGSASDVLRVQATNVDVAQLDRLALGEERLAGRLNADATVSGPTSALRAEGTFTLTQGAFRNFTFESLGGMVDYVGRGLNVDLRLQQNPQAWLTANGYAPLSLFRRNAAGTTGHETAQPGEGIDLRVSTSQIDLGIVQGFTSYVTDVTGILQANVHVTGTGRDPHVDGIIDIRGGAFAIPDLGTAYTGLDTRIDLVNDAVTISEMRILDEHQQVMTVGGSLGVHGRTVGGVDITVQSENCGIL